MPLNLTKVAFGCDSLEMLADRFEARGGGQPVLLTTRYMPKRAAEMEGGSLFWIVKHKLVARSPILQFGDADGGRVSILLAPELTLVKPVPKRAHQGWRYLEGADAPEDIGQGGDGVQTLPPTLFGELSAIGLI